MPIIRAAGPRPGVIPGFSLHERVIRTETNNLLVQGNEQLSKRQSKAALESYTTILTSISPGHPIALVNRALAYLDLGFPELAATDGFKAKLAVQDIKEQQAQNLRPRILYDLLSYATVCERAIKRAEAWTVEPTCYIGNNHLALEDDPLKVEPANITMGTRMFRKLGRKDMVDVLLWDIDTKATYRLAFGLYKVGAGARMDALHQVQRKVIYLDSRTQDSEAFENLEDEILQGLEVDLYREDRMTDYLGFKGKERDCFQMAGTRGENRTWQALINRELYPWNQFELDLEGKDVPERLVRDMTDVAPNTQVRAIKPDTGKLTQLTLIANRDIYPGEVVLEEQSSFYVTTACSDSKSYVYCNACATKLLIAPDHNPYDEHTDMFVTTCPGSESPTDENTDINTSPHTSDISDAGSEPFFHSQDVGSNGQDRPNFASAHTLTPPSEKDRRERERSKAPSPSPLPYPQSPQYCPNCRVTLFCSQSCYYSAAATFHNSLCGSGIYGSGTGGSRIEDWLRRDILNLVDLRMRTDPGLSISKGYVNPDDQCVRELLLCRILAFAVKTGQHPLEMDVVKYLGGGESVARKLDEKDKEFDKMSMSIICNPDPSLEVGANSGTGEKHDVETIEQNGPDMPWSFEANIKRPCMLLRKMGADLVQDTRFDGWIINTLMAKIEKSIRITKRTRQARVDGYKPDHTSITGDDTVTVGSLHTFLSFMGKEELVSIKGNVVVKEMGKGFIKCFAVGKGKRHLPSTIGMASSSNGEMNISSNGDDNTDGGVNANSDGKSNVNTNGTEEKVANGNLENGNGENNGSSSSFEEIDLSVGDGSGAPKTNTNDTGKEAVKGNPDKVNGEGESESSSFEDMDISFDNGDINANVDIDGNINSTGEADVITNHPNNSNNGLDPTSFSFEEMDTSFDNGNPSINTNTNTTNPDTTNPKIKRPKINADLPSFAILSQGPSSSHRIPAIKKGEPLILCARNPSQPLVLPDNTVRSWLNNVNAPPNLKAPAMRYGDGSGKLEEQSFYDGVIGG